MNAASPEVIPLFASRMRKPPLPHPRLAGTGETCPGIKPAYLRFDGGPIANQPAIKSLGLVRCPPEAIRADVRWKTPAMSHTRLRVIRGYMLIRSVNSEVAAKGFRDSLTGRKPPLKWITEPAPDLMSGGTEPVRYPKKLRKNSAAIEAELMQPTRSSAPQIRSCC